MANFLYGRITPAAGAWHEIISATADAKINFIQAVNLDIEKDCNFVLALRQTGDEMIAPPQSVAVTVTGGVGSTKYEYAVTALMPDGGETSAGVIQSITNGTDAIGDINYHTVTWGEVVGALKYRVYVRANGVEVRSKTVLATGTLQAVNNGDWLLADKWPWINLTGLRALLAYEKLPPSTTFQMDSLIKLAAGWELRYFVSGNVSVSASGEV